jgi:prolipoprotein diacylglyceryltransferase
MAGPFTAGQLYSLPMIAVGLFFVWYCYRLSSTVRAQ